MINERNRDLENAQKRLKQKEQSLNQKLGDNNRKEKELERLRKDISEQRDVLTIKLEEVNKSHRKQVEQLEAISQLSADEAKKQLQDWFKQHRRNFP